MLPGGVDTHCHIEQLRAGGDADEESFDTGSTSCLAGGTTRVVTFSTQFKGRGILRAARRVPPPRRKRRWSITASTRSSPIPPTRCVHEEIPQVVAAGVRSLKVFLTYDPLHLDDRQFLRVLAAARRTGALVTVHCENYEAIGWRTEALLADGRTGAEIPRLVAPAA